jgi:hypothetical protein
VVTSSNPALHELILAAVDAGVARVSSGRVNPPV